MKLIFNTINIYSNGVQILKWTDTILCGIRFYFTSTNESSIIPVPVKIYIDAEQQKAEILKDNKGKSGIYMWKNNINEKFYIGSSNNLKRRFISYYDVNSLRKENGMLINKALLKYGHSAFTLYILEYCKVEDLLIREQYYFDTFKPTYNICRTAGSTLGRLHTSDAKDKISNSKLGTNIGETNHFFGKNHALEAKDLIKNAKLNKNLSSETKEKISLSKTGVQFTEEHKMNLSLSKKNNKELLVLDLRTSKETIYSSISLAERTLQLPKDSIRVNLKSKSKTPYRGTFVFRLI